MLSNLLQELALAEDYGRKNIILDEARLNENPVNCLSRMIRNIFWDGLTRSIDADGLESICADPKAFDQQPRIYIPYGEKKLYDYYSSLSKTRPSLCYLQVDYLPQQITPEFVRDINDKPGLLALHMNEDKVTGELQGCSFVVPGGRFNEMYGWDSYFEIWRYGFMKN
ncbi:unnamed protein product [Cunninghamella echinulata]